MLQMFATIAQGGAGAIAAAAHLQTRRFVQMIRALGEGTIGDARDLWQTLVPWSEAAFAEPNPAPVKAMLAQQGAIAAELRPPITPCSEHHRAAMVQAFAWAGSTR